MSARSRRAAPVAADPPAQLLAFYPQAGILGQDLYVTTFVDLDESPDVVRDYACGGHSYDGHTGIDSMVRSFREVRIGVPGFAAGAFAAGFAAGAEPPATAIAAQIAASRIAPVSATSSG